MTTINKILKNIDIELESILKYKNNYAEKIIFKKLSSNEEVLDNILDLYEIYC